MLPSKDSNMLPWFKIRGILASPNLFVASQLGPPLISRLKFFYGLNRYQSRLSLPWLSLASLKLRTEK
jgi:hypothetical protein